MGLQICIKDTGGMVKNHKCEHLDYKNNNRQMCMDNEMWCEANIHI